MECPYCEFEFDDDDVCADAVDGLEVELKCPKCEKKFLYTVYIEFQVDTEKLSCKKGGPHEYHFKGKTIGDVRIVRCDDCEVEVADTTLG